MQPDQPCRICREPVPKWDIYCGECADHMRTVHEITTREETVGKACQALGWSVFWHGPSLNRWCVVWRADGQGSCAVSLDLAGQVLNLETKGKLNLSRLTAWLAALTSALEP